MRRDASGNALSGELQVNTYTTGYQERAAVASDSGGNFVVAWYSFPSSGYDHQGSGIMARRFDAAANPIGGEFNVNAFTLGDQNLPAVATDSAGNFVVTWFSTTGPGNDTSYGSAQAQRFSSNGLFSGNQFQVNTYTPGSTAITAIDANVNDAFIILWSSAADSDVHARRFGTGRPIRGGRLLIKDRTGDEVKRKVIFIAKDLDPSIPDVIGDPTTEGATLRIALSGGTASDETFVLDPEGWTPLGTTGFAYGGPTAADGDPVRRVLIKRTPRGKAILKAILSGNVGTQPLDVVPPNPGFQAHLVLTIPGGGVYCTSFGGGDEGAEVVDEAGRWKMLNASGKSCPDL